jgi:hypothetical protein
MGSDDGAPAGVGLQDNGGKSLGGDLRMNEAVECVVEGEGVGLLADESGAFFEAEVADIVAQNGVHRA